jgi:putative transposase
MIIAHKIALDPNNAQRTYFAKACGVARLAYNFGLAEWKDQYAVGGRPCEREMRRYFNSIKDERFPFVREVTKCSPQLALMNLGEAFKNFFAGRAKFPVFKKKGKSRDSFEISNDTFDVDGPRIRIPSLGWVRMCESLRFTGKILSATISRTADQWFASIAVELPNKSIAKHEGPAAGIDFGCTNFATMSTGEVVAGPKPHKALLNRLRRLNKSLNRKVRGSRNRAKARAKVAKLHARIANIRRDFLHKFTTSVVRRFSLIGIEDLNVSGMAKTTLARSVLDQSPYEMRRQLEYKAPMHGSKMVVADRFYPSSKLCSVCGEKNATLKLSDRKWTCAGCGTVHDRDGNASQNLKQNAVSYTVSACGVSSSVAGLFDSAKLGTMKQEPDSKNAVGLFG